LAGAGTPLEDAAQSVIAVELQPASAPGFAAAVQLHGEHDLATSGELSQALSSIDGDVLVDMTSCQFVDSTVLRTLVTHLHKRAGEGKRLELLIPPTNRMVTRTFHVSGLAKLFSVNGAIPAAPLSEAGAV
jgi:anti-anti-sigma factor